MRDAVKTEVFIPTPGDWIEEEEDCALWEMSQSLGRQVDQINALRDAIDRHLLESGYQPPG